MPPKKGAKKAAKGKGAKVESAAPPEISKEELEEQIVRLREELDREREERNYFQLERDEIHTFLEIAKRQLEESKAGLRNKDLEKEETEELHREQIKVYKQKVKHLLYEHQNAISELKAERVVSTKMMETEHAGQENELRKDMRDLKVDFKEQKIAYQNHVKDLQLKHDEELTQTRNNFEGQVREIEAKYETKMHTLRQEQDCRRKTEIREIEDRKNSQITTLMKNHEKAFNDTKNYYNDITRSKMELIDTLKEQVENMKKKDEKKDKDMAEISQQNKHMTETMQKATEEVTDLQKQVLNYHKDKASLANARARLKANEQDLKDLKWEHELLEQKFSKIQTERDELYQKFTKAIQEVQQKSGFKNLLLERKLEALTDTLETKEAQLNEVLSATNMDQRAFGGMTHKFEEVLDSKNAAIKNLQYELARVCKAHNDLLRTYEAKLGEFGIPVEELGFKPLENSITGQTLGQGPAHSVSAAK